MFDHGAWPWIEVNIIFNIEESSLSLSSSIWHTESGRYPQGYLGNPIFYKTEFKSLKIKRHRNDQNKHWFTLPINRNKCILIVPWVKFIFHLVLTTTWKKNWDTFFFLTGLWFCLDVALRISHIFTCIWSHALDYLLILNETICKWFIFNRPCETKW